MLLYIGKQKMNKQVSFLKTDKYFFIFFERYYYKRKILYYYTEKTEASRLIFRIFTEIKRLIKKINYTPVTIYI